MTCAKLEQAARVAWEGRVARDDTEYVVRLGDSEGSGNDAHKVEDTTMCWTRDCAKHS